MVAAKVVGEEGREGGRVLSQELPPPGQLLQGQVRSEWRTLQGGVKGAAWGSPPLGHNPFPSVQQHLHLSSPVGPLALREPGSSLPQDWTEGRTCSVEILTCRTCTPPTQEAYPGTNDLLSLGQVPGREGPGRRQRQVTEARWQHHCMAGTC